MDLWSSLKPVVASTMTLQHRLCSGLPANIPKIHPWPDLQRRITVRVDPYAHTHTQHIKVKVTKHFVYIQYGCGMQSEASWSLSNDIIKSFGLRSTPKTPESSTPDPWPTLAYHCNKGRPMCSYTAYQGSKTLYIHIQYGSVIQSEACCGLNNDILTSHLHLLRSTRKTPTSTPEKSVKVTNKNRGKLNTFGNPNGALLVIFFFIIWIHLIEVYT